MRRLLLFVLAFALLGAGCDSREELGGAPERGKRTGIKPSPNNVTSSSKAVEIAKRVIIVDGHVDVLYRLTGSKDADGKLTENIAERTKKGDFDYPRAVAGGLDAPFMSIYIPAKYQKEGGAKQLANDLIDLVNSIIEDNPDKFAKAHSVQDVKDNFKAGKMSLPMGIENGAAIEKSLANISHFHKRGVRYITLTHSKDNQICDSSYDDSHTWKGLSPFGKKVVAEMNRVGIMIDISHVTDDAFYQVMELTKTPVIASHSSARHFTPGYERNMDDKMIKALSRNDGVIMINFGSSFINQDSKVYFKAKRDAAKKFMDENNLDSHSDPKVEAWAVKYDADNPPKFATVKMVADHIDHVVKLVGVDHIGFGSDYDGVGDSLPTGLKDASSYPNLIGELLSRGYNEQDIEKMAGGNVLRVWKAVEDYASK